MTRECVGPRCCKLGMIKSMSGKRETKNRRGTFTSAFRSLDDVFPNR